MKKLITATYAPMKDGGELNLNLITDYTRFLKRNNISGAFVNGSTGDFVSLSLNERKNLIEAWASERSENFMVINHVGHNNLREAVDLAKHSIGKTDAIAALPPYYFRIKTLSSLVEYCSEIARSVQELPFYYYHIPVLTGANFPMIEFMQQMEKNAENFAGIKFTYDDLEEYEKCRLYNSKYEIYYGVDEQLFSSLTRGAEGWVGSTYNHLAPLYHQIINCYNDGELNKCQELQNLARLFVDTIDSKGGFNGGGKSFMRLFDLDMGPCRFPHTTFGTKDLTALLHIFKEKGITPYLSNSISSGITPKH